MKAIVLNRDGLKKDELQALEQQGVDMDDWNFAVIFDEKHFIADYEEPEYCIARVLGWSYQVKYYRVELNGQQVGIGVQYH